MKRRTTDPASARRSRLRWRAAILGVLGVLAVVACAREEPVRTSQPPAWMMNLPLAVVPWPGAPLGDGLAIAVLPEEVVIVDLAPTGGSPAEAAASERRLDLAALDDFSSLGPLASALREVVEARRARGDTVPSRVDLFVDRGLSMDPVVRVISAAGHAGANAFAFAVHTPAGVAVFEAGLPMFCACMATPTSRPCGQPRVTLAGDGAYVTVDPALSGDCRVVKRSARNPAVPPVEGEPPWRGRVLVDDDGRCPSVAAEELEAELPALMRRAARLAPGCAYGSVTLAFDAGVEATIRALGASVLAGLRTDLDLREEVSPPSCERTLPWSEIADAAPADPWQKRPRCVDE